MKAPSLGSCRLDSGDQLTLPLDQCAAAWSQEWGSWEAI